MSTDALSLDRRHIGSAVERTDDAHESMRGALNTMKKIAGPLVVALVAALGGSMLLDKAVDAGKITGPAQGGMLDAFRTMGNALNGKAAEFSAWLRGLWNARFGATVAASGASSVIAGGASSLSAAPVADAVALPEATLPQSSPVPAPSPVPTPTELYEADPSPSDLRPYDEAPPSVSPAAVEPPILPAPAETIPAPPPAEDLPIEDPFAESDASTPQPTEEVLPAVPSEPVAPEPSTVPANPNATPEPDLDAETEDVLELLEEGV